LIRASAKNHDFVTIVVDPADYVSVLDELAANQCATTLTLRRKLAAKAYARTAAYDSAIATWFARQQGDTFPERLTLTAERLQTLRYGENPHQQAAFYSDGSKRPGVATARQVQGKELSYNNINDTDAAYECVAEFSEPAVVVIKHANPSGVAVAADQYGAYLKAYACDPVSIYGGIVAVNRTLGAATATDLAKRFLEVIIAPDATPEALEILARRKDVRVLLAGTLPDPASAGMTLKSVAGGYLFQSRDNGHLDRSDLRVVTRRSPTDRELADLLFAFTVCKHVKSNAIVYARDGATVGVGAGQMNRRDSSRIAALRAAESGEIARLAQSPAIGSVVASDAFFPFADGLLAAAEAGATAVIQPGGSMRDKEVIEAADKAGLAMVFTGMRHFRH
jgi:phosphoribosylaminoimidazolecarboxamide formyltransferase/IMP cyclohydrolase